MKKLLPAFMLMSALSVSAAAPECRIFEQDNFPRVKGMESVIRHKAKTESSKKATRTEDEEVKTHLVKIHITHSDLSRGITLFYFKEGEADMAEDFDYYESTGILEANLPEGKLDLVVEFNNMYINQEAGYFVNRGESFYLIDDVEVTEDTPMLEADANECKILPISFVLANGEPLKLGTQKWLGTEMGPEEGGNCISGSSHYTFYNSKYSQKCMSVVARGVPTYYKDFGLDAENDNPMTYWIPKVNKASDRWSFVFRFETYTENYEGGSIVVAVNPDSEPVNISLEDYKKLDWNFAPMELQGIEYDYGVSFGDTGEMMEGGTQVKIGTPLDMYSAVVNRANGIENLNLMSQAKAALEVDRSDPDWPEYYGILEPLSNIYSDSREFHGGAYSFTALPKENGEKYRRYLPEYTFGNGYANYSQKKLAMKFGDSAPYIVTSLWRNEEKDTDVVKGFLVYNYIFDLAGAERTDWDKLVSEVYFNDKLVKDKDTDLDSFTYSWDSTKEGLGKMRYILTDSPDLEIDGIPIVSTSEISYDQTIEAWEPPTLTSILFRNWEGDVTNRMAEGKDAKVEVYGGSTKWDQYWENPWADRWFSQGVMTIGYDVEAKVEYAPSGSEEWTSLPLTENEAERSAAYGNHYTAALSDVDKRSDKGWYDLRITLTTPEGNKQVQTLSPAFKLENMSGIGKIELSETARYFDLQGMQLVNPKKGQVVICIDSKGARKIVY